MQPFPLLRKHHKCLISTITCRMTRQRILGGITVNHRDTETTSIGMPSMRARSSPASLLSYKPAARAVFILLDLILVNLRQTFLFTQHLPLVISGAPNKILCRYRPFLSQAHLLVLHHAEGNYTFIYYTSPNIKPQKTIPKTVLFNHPSRYTSFKRQSLRHVLKATTSKASFQRLLHLLQLSTKYQSAALGFQ